MKNTPCIPVVGVVTAMWKRHELTDIVFANLKNIRESLANIIDLRLVVAGSEGDASRTLAERHGFSYIDVPNSPLGAKWNAALGLLRDEQVDGICVIGSDDLLNASYFHMVAESIRNGEKLFGLDSFYVLDRFSGRMFLWMGYPPPRDRETIGLGRFIHKDYIEMLNWQLWEDNREEGLDLSMRNRIEELDTPTALERSYAVKPIADYGIIPVDIKHEQQMWTYESVATNAHCIRLIGAPRAFLEKHYPYSVTDSVFAPCMHPENSVCEDIYIPPLSLDSVQDDCKQHEKEMYGLIQNTACGKKKEVFVSYCMRRNITLIPRCNDIKRAADIISAFVELSEQCGTIQLHVQNLRLDSRLTTYGIFSYTPRNIYVWRNIFRVYLIDADMNSVHLVNDLVNYGNTVICCGNMQKYFPHAKRNALFIVETPSDAMKMAIVLHDRQNLYKISHNRLSK